MLPALIASSLKMFEYIEVMIEITLAIYKTHKRRQFKIGSKNRLINNIKIVLISFDF